MARSQIIATIGASGVISLGDSDVLQYALQQAAQVSQMMASRLPQPGATFAMYQSYHETAAFSDYKWKEHNNGSGIKYNHQRGATAGKNNYAYFATREDWANAFQHELTKKSNPAGAQTLEDYVARLKANGYMEASASDYLSGLKRARLVTRAMPAAEWDYSDKKEYNPDTGVSTDKPTNPTNPLTGLIDWAKAHPWQAAGGAALGIIVISKLAK